MTETWETKLTDAEAKMLRERLTKHFKAGKTLECGIPDAAMSFGSELLLAAKEKAAQICQDKGTRCSTSRMPLCHDTDAAMIRSSDFGDLFEEKA